MAEHNMMYNIVIEVVSVIVVMIISGSLDKIGSKDSKQKLLIHLTLIVQAILIADIAAWIFDGTQYYFSRLFLYFINTIYWLLQAVYAWLWLLFTDLWSNRFQENIKKRAYIYAIPMIVEIAVVLSNIYTQSIFIISSQNTYVRGEYYLINMLPFYFYMILSISISLQCCFAPSDNDQRQRGISILIYMLLPICGVLFVTFSYGMPGLWVFVTLSLLMVYVNMHQKQILEEELRLSQLENEINFNKTKIMLSQIQPHFLINVLMVIRDLCKTDPTKAEKATMDFAMFIKKNMESLTDTKPIPFEQELNHTKHYIDLEKIRFPDKFVIQYDIKTMQFCLPTLTLQPIVENAIRYGALKHTEGGLVKIGTYETDNFFAVTVWDNGMGYDINVEKNDGCTHVGISNVRNRINQVSSGSLELESVIGRGTKATIYIPKK